MKKILLLTIIISVFSNIWAATLQDVVYLKNGSIIRGMIIEQVPSKSIKIQTNDGSVFFYLMDDVQKITKEPPLNQQIRDFGEDDTTLSHSNLAIYLKAIAAPTIGQLSGYTSLGFNLNICFNTSDLADLGFGFGVENISDVDMVPIYFTGHAYFSKNSPQPFAYGNIGYSMAGHNGFDNLQGFGATIAFGGGIKFSAINKMGLAIDVGYRDQGAFGTSFSMVVCDIGIVF